MKKQLWQNLINQHKNKLPKHHYERLMKIRFDRNEAVVMNRNHGWARKHYPSLFHILNNQIMQPFMNFELYNGGMND